MSNKTETKQVNLNAGSKSIPLNVHTPTYGNNVIEVSPLVKENFFTYDPGFVSTAACESKITWIDGEQGVLLYRGYPIEQLAQHSNFPEVCYLLLNGELPTEQENDNFVQSISSHTMVHQQINNFLNGFRPDAHPMAVMMGVVGALSAFYHDALDITDADDRMQCATRLIAKMPTLAAMCYKYSIGHPLIQPRNEYSYAENFHYMMFSVPSEDWQPDPVISRALDRIFILHADHEQNASTSTVRLAGSTGANPYACISAGIAALWGPAHGGANEACLKMLGEIGSVDRIPEFIARAKDKDDPFRLMGFGHRVYKNHDPRSKIMRETCHEVLEAVGAADNPLFKVALELERIALEDEYFIEKKLYPNVDFYSGLTLSALGIPTSMFTVIFALARTVGWISHWNEMISPGNAKLGRPRQLYTGPSQRDFIDLAKR